MRTLARNVLLFSLLFYSCGSAPDHTSAEPQDVHALLAGIVVDDARSPEVNASYDRDEWKHWIDEDGDCQDTRDEVLSRDGTGVSFDKGGCDVAGGSWNDPYTGKAFTAKGDIDIDHVVPLKDAHVSGGYAWAAAKKERYANYLDRPYHLLAVEDSAAEVSQLKRENARLLAERREEVEKI